LIPLTAVITGISDDLEGHPQSLGGYLKGAQGIFMDVQAQERKAFTKLLKDVAA
jgi:hypothetical protein